jgi:hypothetical protein
MQQGVKLHRMVGTADLGPPAGVLTITDPILCAAGSGRPHLPTVLYIPLTFFYTKNPGAALPLIALQYHEVKINIQWQDQKFIAGNFNSAATTTPQPLQAAVYVDYIYLDTEERRRMAQQSHEYLIEQTQFNEEKGMSSFNNRIDLTFNHPVKELVWVVQPSYCTDCRDATANEFSRLAPFTYSNAAVYEQWLQINGQDRLDKRYGDYFNKVQPYQHHTGSFNPVREYNGYVTSSTTNDNPGGQLGAYMYSFALRPEEHQPSGTCNFSRIDTATLVMTLHGGLNISPETDNNWNVRVYAVNYNILRVMSGMGGLAYSN